MKRPTLRVTVVQNGRHFLANERLTGQWAEGRSPFSALRNLAASLDDYWRVLDDEGEAGLGEGLCREYRALADFLGKPVKPGDPAAVAERARRDLERRADKRS